MKEPDGIDDAIREQLRKEQEAKQKTNGKAHVNGHAAGIEAGNLLSYTCSDSGNSQRLIALHGEELRYSYERNKWFAWDEDRWKPDISGKHTALALSAMTEFLKQAHGTELWKFALQSLNANRISNLLTLAQPQLSIQSQELDSHPYLLNVLNGTLDLSTGVLRQHNREDYITKLVHVNYNPTATCPQWIRFLGEILDPALHGYIQRCFGYSLTGVTSEKAVFILHGKRDAGKSTLLTTFRELIHEYSTMINIDALMSRTHESANQLADLADLCGARFVQTSEAEKDQRLSPSRLKAITQGMGQIKATRKYENPIIFSETHKLWIDTNDKPQIKNVEDQAIFSRLHPIPFPRTVEKIDRKLREKFQAEFEGILAWAIAGALDWKTLGLDKPALVADATEAWKSENDIVEGFIVERCERGDAFTVPASALYSAYRAWAEKSGEHTIISNKEFVARMKDRGHTHDHSRTGWRYSGLRLSVTDED